MPDINNPKMRLKPSMRNGKLIFGKIEKSVKNILVVLISKLPTAINNRMNIPNGTNERSHPNRCLSKGYKTLTSIPDINKSPINKGKSSLIPAFCLITIISYLYKNK